MIILSHLYAFLFATKGIISARDFVYFLSVIVVGLIITDQAIRSKRA
jgi:hypothetical protein